jgi:hypothetical protein
MPKQLLVYNWEEIETLLCQEMQIDPKYFRDYHELVGGEYKDFWLVALRWLVPEHVANGTVVTMYSIPENHEREQLWEQLLFDAYIKVMQKIDPEDKGVSVEFSW